MLFVLHSYRPVADLLAPALVETGDTQIVDLCSGSGGPWPFLVTRVQSRLADAGREPIAVTLTDKFPASPSTTLPDDVSYLQTSVDATATDASVVNGFRTLFTSFHHFDPDNATALLGDAVRNRQGVAIFEFTRRSPLAFLAFFLAPLMIFFALPFLKPRRLKDWLWTLPIPILPLTVLFDGLVSCLRTYSPRECLQLAAAADPDNTFEWESGVKYSLPAGMTYLIGTPKKSGEATPA